MSTETLRSLTHETVEIYARTAKTIVRTYRVGAKRALGGISKRLASTVGATRIEQPLKGSLVNVGQQLASVIGTRVDALSSVADGAIEVIAKGSYNALGGVAGAADRLYRAFPSSAARAFSRVNLPAVRLSRDLAAQISRGAESVAKRVGGEQGKAGTAKAGAAKRSAAKASARPARRPAQKAARAGTKAPKRARNAA